MALKVIVKQASFEMCRGGNFNSLKLGSWLKGTYLICLGLQCQSKSRKVVVGELLEKVRLVLNSDK